MITLAQIQGELQIMSRLATNPRLTQGERYARLQYRKDVAVQMVQQYHKQCEQQAYLQPYAPVARLPE